MNPEAAAALGLHEGDYVFVDANPLDRPYVGWADDQDHPRHKAFRCMVRVKLNPGLPHNFTIMKHTGQIASERSVRRTSRDPTVRARRRHRLPGQLPVRLAPEHHPGLDAPHAPDRHPLPQEDRGDGLCLRL